MKVLTVALMLLLLSVFAFGQDEPFSAFDYPTPYPTPEATPEPTPKCDHSSNRAQRFAVMRFLPPVMVRRATPEGFEYQHTDDLGNYLGQVQVDETTDKPTNFFMVATDNKRRWWVLYCLLCGHVYSIVEAHNFDLKKPPAKRPEKKP